jgi:hypothetical protein
VIAEVEHFSLDELAAWDLDGLSEERRSLVREHIASGCPECTERLQWARQVSTTARNDRLKTPPSEVLQRAVALFRRSTTAPGDRLSSARRFVAGLVFDSLMQPSQAVSRGTPRSARQTLYEVRELGLEVDILIEQDRADMSRCHLTGQVFAADERIPTAVSARAHGGKETRGIIHPTGEFSVNCSTAEMQDLLIWIDQDEIIVRVGDTWHAQSRE